MKLLRISSMLLLLFVGVNAVIGGYLLMIDPSGGRLQLPSHWIINSPFEDYFIPGIILFVTNGLLSLAVAIATLFKSIHYPKLLIIQGSVIVGWIVIQMIMLHLIYWLQFIIVGIGLLIIASGITIILEKNKLQYTIPHH
jgi:hypothetical protein